MKSGVLSLAMRTARSIQYSVHNLPDFPFSPDEGTVERLVGGHAVMLVIDEEVMVTYGAPILLYLSERTKLVAYLAISSDEAAKNLEAVERICRDAAAGGLDRRGIVLAVGGGVVLDIAGLAASLYRRGIGYVRVPTTLTAIVDVAVGIKQAVNFAGKKNALGSFYPPVAAVAHLSFLRSLDRRHISSGIAEILKIALVRDARLFELLEESGPTLLRSRFQFPYSVASEIVVRAQAAMLEELEPNLYEDNLRRLVDFGHTFSPALEEESQYSLAHGEAVAIDMLISLAIGTIREMCRPKLFERVAKLCEAVALPLMHPACRQPVLKRALCDTRRHRAGDLNLVVPTDVGHATFIQHVTESEIAGALEMIADVGTGILRVGDYANARI